MTKYEVLKLFEPVFYEVRNDPIINSMMNMMLANPNLSLEGAFQHLVRVSAESRKGLMSQLFEACRDAPASFKVQGVDMAGLTRPDGTRW